MCESGQCGAELCFKERACDERAPHRCENRLGAGNEGIGVRKIVRPLAMPSGAEEPSGLKGTQAHAGFAVREGRCCGDLLDGGVRAE